MKTLLNIRTVSALTLEEQRLTAYNEALAKAEGKVLPDIPDAVVSGALSGLSIGLKCRLIERIPPLTKSPRTHQSYVHFTTNTNVVPMMEISTIAANAQHMYIVLAMKNIEQL